MTAKLKFSLSAKNSTTHPFKWVLLSLQAFYLGFDLTSVLTSEVNFSHFIFNIPRVLLLEHLCDIIFLNKEIHPLRLTFGSSQKSFEVNNRGEKRESIWVYSSWLKMMCDHEIRKWLSWLKVVLREECQRYFE